ncbi:hypothetical protein EON81_29960 [bacterium]|nr:MAG: hypothetical protein EON81_29960 [bacterium]
MQAYGHDEDRLYERSTSTTSVPWNVAPDLTDLLAPYRILPVPRFYEETRHETMLLLFCGRVFPLFGRVALARLPEHPTPETIEMFPQLPSAWEHRYESWRTDPDRGRREEAAMFFEGIDRRIHDPNVVIDRKRMRDLTERLAEFEAGTDLLISLGSPCALLQITGREMFRPGNLEGVVTVRTNPRLADLGFAREMDPYACYQTIETFLGSQLAQPDLAPQRVGSDEILARQKGFDAMSFRTAAPGAKKEHRAENRKRKRGL